MGTCFGVVEAAQDWLVANGLNERESGLYLRNLFGSLGDVLRAKPESLGDLRVAHSTRGDLNELAYQRFSHGGGVKALGDGLSAVLARIQRKPEA